MARGNREDRTIERVGWLIALLRVAGANFISAQIVSKPPGSLRSRLASPHTKSFSRFGYRLQKGPLRDDFAIPLSRVVFEGGSLIALEYEVGVAVIGTLAETIIRLLSGFLSNLVVYAEPRRRAAA